MARYQADPERRRVAALIDEEVARARAAEAEGGWITYLIRDPRFPDKLGNPKGTPIYVGQSKEFGTRVRSRFDKCEKAATAKDSVERRVTDLLHEGWVAPYEVLERTPTRLTSLISETNWARRCVRRGYDIANLLPEQRAHAPDIAREGIPASWIWPFLVSEAIEDQLTLQLDCAQCGLSLTLDLKRFLGLAAPPKSLCEIRDDPMWRAEPCTGCGKRHTRYVALKI